MPVDLHADLSTEADLLDHVTSVTIACGLHAGSPTKMRIACGAAIRAGVTIGAHVGFRDPAGGGLRYVATSRQELTDDVVYQLGALDGIALAAGGRVSFVRCAGALAEAAAQHTDEAEAVAAAIAAYDDSLSLLVESGSHLQRAAAGRGIETINEYVASSAVPAKRSWDPGGCADVDPQTVARRVRSALNEAVRPRSIGIHITESARAVACARAARETLDTTGVVVQAFSR